MLKIKTPYNAKEFPVKGESSKLPSMTVPDQSMSVQEILRRYASGLSPLGERVPVYDGDEEVPDLKKMDLAEIEQLKKDTSDYIANVGSEIRNKVKKPKFKQKPIDFEEAEVVEEKNPSPTPNPKIKPDTNTAS